ncbi:MAG: hypothetical protein HN790_03885, partial [Methylococcales bacterium]|nr:hypothetical protein [Methylococcales bacterium]
MDIDNNSLEEQVQFYVKRIANNLDSDHSTKIFLDMQQDFAKNLADVDTNAIFIKQITTVLQDEYIFPKLLMEEMIERFNWPQNIDSLSKSTELNPDTTLFLETYFEYLVNPKPKPKPIENIATPQTEHNTTEPPNNHSGKIFPIAIMILFVIMILENILANDRILSDRYKDDIISVHIWLIAIIGIGSLVILAMNMHSLNSEQTQKKPLESVSMNFFILLFTVVFSLIIYDTFEISLYLYYRGDDLGLSGEMMIIAGLSLVTMNLFTRMSQNYTIHLIVIILVNLVFAVIFVKYMMIYFDQMAHYARDNHVSTKDNMAMIL